MRVTRIVASTAALLALAVEAGAGQVVAIVEGDTVTMADVERYWESHDKASFARAQQQQYDGRKNAFDGLLAELLFAHEARRAGLTIEQLAQRIERSSPSPTAMEVKAMYDRSAASKQGITLEQASPVIDAYLRQQKAADARKQLVDRVKATASIDVKVRFEPPRQAVRVAPTDPVMGHEGAPVEVVEFSDFECPYCRQTAPVLKQLVASFGGRVAVFWKDYPLPAHAFAKDAAEAAQCAHEQGKFWAYHDLLFAHADRLAPSDLRRHAEAAGLDLGLFDRCVGSGTYRSRVLAGIEQGRAHGVSATPTVFINGRMIVGARPFEDYERVVREELGRVTEEACASGTCPVARPAGN